MSQPNPSFAYPTRTKIVIAAAVAIAIGGFVLAGLSADTDPNRGVFVSGATNGPAAQVPDDPDGVLSFDPNDGDQVFAQEEIRVRLSPGWTGEVVLQPSSGSAIVLPDDEVELTALNELLFQPGEDKVIERLPLGDVCVRATVWDQVRGRAASQRVEAWCFDVT